MSLEKNSNPGMLIVGFNSSSLKCFIFEHSNRKSSTWLGQKGQKRLSLSIFGHTCLPVSIAKRWLESLSFVTFDRISVFLISTRYFSIPISNQLGIATILFHKVSNITIIF